jgi:hypothetical protein
MIISSFHTGPGRNRVIYILKGSFERIQIDTMFTYGSLRRSIPFRIRNRRNRTCFFRISRYFLDPIHLFELLLNREIKWV